jgi:hypothetical protein
MYEERLRGPAVAQTVDETKLIFDYEIGVVCRQIIYSRRYGKDSAVVSRAEEEMGFADAFTMLGLMAELRGFDPPKLQAIGLEHFIERMGDLKKYGVKEESCQE